MTPTTVHLFVFDGLSDWEAGYAVAGIHNPRFQAQPGRYRVRTAALRASPVTTMGGVRILPDLLLESVTPADSAMLILPGGDAWEAPHAGQGGAQAVRVAAAFLEAGIPVAAICAATAGLARGGLLDRRRHTSNARAYLAATGYGGGALYVDAPAVADRGVITATGIAPVDFAREIFRALALYPPPVLAAWYALFKTGDAGHFETLVRAAGG